MALAAAMTIVMGRIGLFAVGWGLSAPVRFAGIARDTGTVALAPFEPPADDGAPARVEKGCGVVKGQR